MAAVVVKELKQKIASHWHRQPYISGP